MYRRDFIKIGASSPLLAYLPNNKKQFSQDLINHSICRWCYSNTPLELLAEKAKDLNISSIELLDPDEWDVVLNKGLNCAVSNGSPLGITKGFNDPKNHDQLYSDSSRIIPQASERGIQQVICFSGNRNNISEKEGLENCAVGLEPILKLAEQYNITIIMELLNSKVDHHDYQCDNSIWGVNLVEKIGKSNFKLLYDIYHMQIMEGDVISTIQKNKNYRAHYHTGGVPGRNEIDETQELNYPAIIKAIHETDFAGYIAQEFIPTWDKPFSALEKAINICTI